MKRHVLPEEYRRIGRIQWLLNPVVVLFLSVPLYAQQAKVDFEKIHQAYQKLDVLNMDIAYSYFQDKHAEKATERVQGYFKKHGGNIKSDLMGIQTVQNKRYLFVVDAENKTVVVGEPKIDFNVPLSQDLEEMLGLCSKVNFEKYSGDIYQYELIFPDDSQYHSLVLRFHKKNYLMHKIIVHYQFPVPVDVTDENSPKKVPKVEIAYSNYNTVDASAESIFSEARYFTERAGTYTGVGKYKGYTFINNSIAQ